jgi:nucleotide sugar dehydrogenase
MKIGVIGQGFVGNAVYQKFKDYYTVLTYDLDETKCNATEQQVFDCEVVFVCLPTPMKKDGGCSTFIIDPVLAAINANSKTDVVVIKSTVIPGTVENWNKTYGNIQVVHNPEFLTERNAVQEFNNQTRVILGGPRPATTKLKQIYSKVFPKAHVIKTDSTHAEMIKYLTNTFLSVKVSFANEIYQVCEKLKIDYDKVVEYATMDERLGESHWSVPGHDNDFGFGGHCFPKDLAAIINLTDNLGTVNNVLKATKDTNDTVRRNRDWEQMKGRAVV